MNDFEPQLSAQAGQYNGNPRGRLAANWRGLVRASLAIGFAAALLPAQAQTIIDEWASIKVPPAPELKTVKVDPKETALLLLDFVKQNCSPRPRCVASLPKMQGLLERSRQAGMTVVYSIVTGQALTDVLPEVAPRAGEASVASGPEKFMNTDLDKILKDKGVKTVIVAGTAAEGAVLNTAAAAALRGYKVVFPVDGASSVNPFGELYTVRHLGNSPVVSRQVTLTRIDLIGF